MFQSFETTASPDTGRERLAALREAMARAGLDAFLVPRADAHQGEYVAPRDARLAWLTGFTGSAGIAAITAREAGLFVDGRYRVQAREQSDPVFTPVDWPETKPGPWLAERLGAGATVGFDGWLHTTGEVEALRRALEPRDIAVLPVDNPLDAIWDDRPDPPLGRVTAWPEALAGLSAAQKREAVAAGLREAGQAWAVLTLPDSIAWLLNIRGSDLPRIPVAQGFALIEAASGAVRLFMEPSKLDGLALEGVGVLPPDGLIPALANLSGPVRVDRDTAPEIVARTLAEAGIDVVFDPDPCLLPKACKNSAEIAATRHAHLRDAGAMCEFLAWLDEQARAVVDESRRVTEIDVVRALEGFRRAGGDLLDIAFDTIAGSGPHGAVVHYRVTEDSDRALAPGELLLVDSGGQYIDGTTDITRTIAVGAPTREHVECFTLVLKGMIALSRALWPEGRSGRDLDALARAPLWRTGRDYDHGTGHGVGVYLSVHEGPQRVSRLSEIALEAGMILSNEPGYYREGDFGIRIENLVLVIPAPDLPSADPHRAMLAFETLTLVPIARDLIDAAALSPGERAWIDAYHARIATALEGRLSDAAAVWLARATAPL